MPHFARNIARIHVIVSVRSHEAVSAVSAFSFQQLSYWRSQHLWMAWFRRGLALAGSISDSTVSMPFAVACR